ncbi:MFS transporter [Paenibacillus elgii]
MSTNSKARRYGLLAAVGLGILLNPLNTTMITVAFSRLEADFHIGYDVISWLIATYYVASAIAQPVMGKLSDLIGQKRVFLFGLGLVTISSLLAPWSPSIGWLIAFRVIQAIGTSSLFPSGMGLIRSSITEKQAGALGVLTIFTSTSAAFGPVIGGFLIHYGDWPAIFWVNFPVIAISFLLSVKFLPKDGPRKRLGSGVLDIAGIVLFTALIVVWLLFFLSFGSGLKVWILLLTGIVLGFLFYKYELTRTQPFIDISFLKKNLHVCLVYLQYLAVNIVFYAILFSIPSYLKQVQHLDDRIVGVTMLALSGFAVAVTPLVSRLADRSGIKMPLIIGSSFLLAGVLLILLFPSPSTGHMIAVLSVFGVGIGFQNLSLQAAIFSLVPKEETGIASGLFMTSRFIGTILSSSILGAFFSGGITAAGVQDMAMICALIVLALLALSIGMPGGSKVAQTSKSLDK